MDNIHTIILKDGRELCYAEYGSPSGFPVMYCHGWQSGKYEGQYFNPTAKKSNIRLIAVDRPGTGDSSFKEIGGFCEWANDVKELMNSLKIEEFGMFGVSGGAPYALACALKFPNKIKNTYIYGGVAPASANFYGPRFLIIKTVMGIVTYIPGALGNLLDVFKKVVTIKPALYVWLLHKRIPLNDIRRDSKKGIDIFIKNKTDSIKNGCEGVVQEMKLLLKSWDFDLGNIKSNVMFWVGSKDDLAPTGMTKYFHEKIPNTKIKVIDSGGHFAITEIVDEIFDTMSKEYENS